MKKTLIPESFHVILITAVVLLLYLVALIFPDNWWGLHYPAYLGGGGWFMVLFAIGISSFGQNYSLGEGLAKSNMGTGRWGWIIVLTIIAGVFFHNMPIFLDVYGDASTMISDPDYVMEEFTDFHKELIFSFDFTNLKLGSGSISAFVVWLSYTREISLGEAFQLIGTTCGMGYVFFMLAAVFRIAKNNQQSLLFTLIVMGSPVLLIFCGHIELYAPVLFALAMFFYGLIRFIEKPSWITGIVVFVLCVFNLKLHISGALTFLIFGNAVLIHVLRSKGKEIGWRNFGVAFLSIFFVAGFSFYAFVTSSIFGTRTYTEENLTDAIFLPIKSSDPAPLDRYNLFSWNHVFDYFNMSFLWSAIAIIIVLVALIFRRKKINWNNTLVLTSGIGLIVFFVVFFVLNPLLGMLIDWDLMSIPAVALIVFAAALVAESREEKEGRSFASYLMAPALGLFLIGLSGIFVNANQESEANRLIAVGKYSYKTYWIGASATFKSGLSIKKDGERYEELKDALVELEPYSIKGKDLQYAAFVNLMGKYHQFVTLDTLEAHRFYMLSESYDKTLLPNMYNLSRTALALGDFATASRLAENLVFNKYPNEAEAIDFAKDVAKKAKDEDALEKYSQSQQSVSEDEAQVVFDLTVEHFMNKEFNEAQELVANLVKYKYPSERKALRMAIHISLEAGDYEASRQYCVDLLKVIPDDEFIQKILHLLNTSEDKSNIKNYFRQS